MSMSYYRGKLVTSPELKGPFTEAYDELKGMPFDVLIQEAKTNSEAKVHVLEKTNPNDVPSIFINIGNLGLTIQIKEDGSFEILEGAA